LTKADLLKFSGFNCLTKKGKDLVEEFFDVVRKFNLIERQAISRQQQQLNKLE